MILPGKHRLSRILQTIESFPERETVAKAVCENTEFCGPAY